MLTLNQISFDRKPKTKPMPMDHTEIMSFSTTYTKTNFICSYTGIKSSSISHTEIKSILATHTNFKSSKSLVVSVSKHGHSKS